ncbi:MAG TPA: hypothetical protein VMB50_20880 [Myxococcales bacterium]|nr:hypothetical protein [Myxococcales bacterium]
MAGPLYQVHQPAIAPRFLSGAYGAAWLAAHGQQKDFLVDRAKQAIKARLPGLGPLDALAAIGLERGIAQGPTESSSSYATRLRQAWQAWATAGSAWGILLQLAAMGYASAYVVYPNGRQYGPSSGVTVTNPPALLKGPVWAMSSEDGQADGLNDHIARMWNRSLLLFSPAPASWSGSPPSPGSGWSDELNTLRAVLTSWGAGHAAKEGIAVAVGTSGGAARAMFDFPPGRTFTGDGAGTFATQAGSTVYTY